MDNDLTPQQVVQDWIHKVLNPKPIMDITGITEFINWLYNTKLNLSAPEILIFNSPIEVFYKATHLRKKKNPYIEVEFREIMRTENPNKLFLKHYHLRPIRAQINRFNFIVFQAIRKEVGNRSYYFEVGKKIYQRTLLGFLYNGSLPYSAPWVCSYDYFYITGQLKTELIERFRAFLHCNPYYVRLLKNQAIISKPPVEIHIGENNLLHNDHGPALKFPDGFSVYALHGVLMPPNIVMLPRNHIDPTLLFDDSLGVDVRREIVRKIGVERVYRMVDITVVDSWNGYELLDINITPINISGRFLKMKDKSTGVFYIEGVPPKILTCKKALEWRSYGSWNPTILT
ncbi:MAG: hypothetical protein HQL06_17440 [Nitrospirae bacterium]|nr:hypothetical protein [Nitrospirota bacterium]